MIRVLAILFGIIFIFIGVSGFLPSFYINQLLFGYFMVSFVHNLFHIVSGVIAIMAATTYYYARLYFQVLGVVYGIVAILGFLFDLSFIMLPLNLADNILHLVIALVALYLGFYSQKKFA